MEENIVLVIFMLLPALLLYALYLLRTHRPDKDQRPERILRIIAVNILVFLFILSVIVFSAEGYYRFVYDSTDSFGLTKVAKRWFKQYYHFNTFNVRDNSNDYSIWSDRTRTRITFLGDSYTAGHGIKNVDDRFANKMRAQCPECVVHVFARNGNDTGGELFSVQSLAEAGYDFNIVILVYNINDVEDMMPEWQATLARINGAKPGYLGTHSYLFNMLYYRLMALREPDIADYYQSIKAGYQGDVWERQMMRLANIRKIIEERGGRLVVVTFPFLHALGQDYAYREIHRKLNAFWEIIGVPHLDLYDVYAPHKPKTLMVNAYDAHPNEFAHRLASQSIYEFLRMQDFSRN